MSKQKPGVAKQFAENELGNAPKAFLEDLYENYYKHRREIYMMNLVRGVFFGFGSVIGGTIVVALLLWILSALDFVPFLNDIVNAAKHSLEKR